MIEITYTDGILIDTSALNAFNYKGPGRKPFACLQPDMIRGNIPLLVDGVNPHANKVIEVDDPKYQNLVEIEAGVKIHEFMALLASVGLGLQNIGGYDGQSMAGVMGTSTHGSGITLPPICDQVVSLVLVCTGQEKTPN